MKEVIVLFTANIPTQRIKEKEKQQQENVSQTKEIDNSPNNGPKETDIYDLIQREFETTIMNLLSEVRRKTYELSDNFKTNRKDKKHQTEITELNNTVTALKMQWMGSNKIKHEKELGNSKAVYWK